MNLRRLFSLIFLLAASITSNGQAHLRITSLSSFPVAPTDTAYESRVYDTIAVTIQNLGNPTITDNIFIFLRNSNVQHTNDTISYDTSTVYTLQPNLDVNLNIGPYRLRPLHFDDGDNIVVVWPAARFSPYTCDSLTFHVYFVSLAANQKEVTTKPISIGPNPTQNYLLIDLGDEKSFKQVRILNSLGAEVSRLSMGKNYISTSEWASGIYYLEYTDYAGHLSTRKIIKE